MLKEAFFAYLTDWETINNVKVESERIQQEVKDGDVGTGWKYECAPEPQRHRTAQDDSLMGFRCLNESSWQIIG